MRKIRIGIDVGGTFTHAVAIDADTLELVGQTKVFTTHTAPEGVAKGILDSLHLLLQEARISPEEVVLIAHSTTQATNALLEGDVAPVGILGMGKGIEKLRAQSETEIGKIELSPGKFLSTYHRFLDTSEAPSKEKISQLISELVKEGAQAIVAAEAFSVDDPTNELLVLETACEMGLPATATHEISQLYGLKMRTRTAVINASILPKMIETANMTEKSVRKAGIKAPLMIMRSDGGVMDIEQMRRRPILTILSGPAAGVAAALMFVRISDGIFLEVGGTSTDISAIKNGKAQIKTAEIGGHRVYLRTLDVRTIGLAGGSMCRCRNKKIIDVGPRSAHIAGLGYSAFTAPELLKENETVLKYIQPKPGDPDDYVYLENKQSSLRVTVTPTCAANLLGFVPQGDYAEGNKESVRCAFSIIAKEFNSTPEEIATKLLEVSAPKCIAVINQLLRDYELDSSLVSLVGGGGGAAAIVPFVAKKMKMDYRIAPESAVISAIGAALAMIRETRERMVVNPTNDDILRIRAEVEEAVIKMGAKPETIEVQVEIDASKNILRATATGTTEFRERDLKKLEVDLDTRRKIAASSMHIDEKQVSLVASTTFLDVFSAEIKRKRLLGLFEEKTHPLRVVDKEGVIRLQIVNGVFLQSAKEKLQNDLRRFLNENASYGDAGKILPNTFILYGARILDLTGLLDAEQIVCLAEAELRKLSNSEPIVIVASLKR